MKVSFIILAFLILGSPSVPAQFNTESDYESDYEGDSNYSGPIQELQDEGIYDDNYHYLDESYFPDVDNERQNEEERKRDVEESEDPFNTIDAAEVSY